MAYQNYETNYTARSNDEFANNNTPNYVVNNDNSHIISYYDVPIKDADNENVDIEKNSNKKNQHEKVMSKDAVKWYKNTKAILTAFKSNFLLIFLPPAIILKRFQFNSGLIFIFNFLAIIPLSKIMTVGIDDFATRLPPAYGVVLHACAGNFVELVILGYALMDRNYAIVRSSLLGAILCNILLILGVVFLAGSWPTKHRDNKNNNTELSTQLWISTSASTLALAVLALVTPAAFRLAAPEGTGIECDIQTLSHATAIILLLVYAGLLVFQLKTHANEAIDTDEHVKKTAQYFLIYDVFLVALSVTGITVCARYLVTSIEHLAQTFRVGNGFIGMVLIPLCVVSNFMEHYEAIKEASEDKVDTAQIALLIGPLLVLIGWMTSRPLTLDFNVLEVSVLACAVLIVNYLVADGKANWLEGYMLIMSYIMIAVAFFYLPNIPDLPENLNCSPWSRNLPPGSGINIEDLTSIPTH
ncbi:21632_t:CDS:2 [Dentiscutata erythropus]|uniref:Vacuolar calcium ion transporter n=1 Tax=Dentiscutata erythropus TaxID=1348616 RepID=A0A9N9E829_9GLOM|nr:21632_t:CDS:2 [Dentiscutata erythropus]